MIDFNDAPQDGGLNWPQNRFAQALQILNDTFKDPTIVEIGCLREGQGSSSEIFAWYVSKYGGKFRTCDIQPTSIEKFLNEYVKKKNYTGDIEGTCQDGVEYLKTFPSSMNLIYIDSYDSWPGTQCWYSSIHPLQLFTEARTKLIPGSLILIDDILSDNIHLQLDEKCPCYGKGMFLIPFLLAHDKTFKCLHKGYQYLFQVI